MNTLTVAHLISSAGLILDIAGAVVLAYGLFATKEEAIRLGSMYLGADTLDERLKAPPVADRVRQSRNAKIGLALMICGFTGQLIGTWWPAG